MMTPIPPVAHPYEPLDEAIEWLGEEFRIL